MERMLDVLIGWPAAVLISVAVWLEAKIWERHGK